jgi:hypothetical protein
MIMHRWSKKMREKQNGDIPKVNDLRHDDPQQGTADLDKALRSFRDSIRASAEKPDFFWRRQHNSILARLNRPSSRTKYRKLIWVPAALGLLLCLFFFVENSKAPTPDIAAGSDQNLLIDVERALDQDCPDALAPAALLVFESGKPGKAANNQKIGIRR